jgi:hypothetical protein
MAATDTTIAFESETPIVHCTTNPSFAISQCSLQPMGCTPGIDCQATRCLVVSFGGTIPSGSQLYFCNAHIASDAAGGEYALRCSAVGVFNSAGKSLNPQCTDGQVQVVRPTPTRTPSAGLCIGDCNNDGLVTVDEILTLVNMALGNGGSCPNGLVAMATPDVSVILHAVNNALNTCSY